MSMEKEDNFNNLLVFLDKKKFELKTAIVNNSRREFIKEKLFIDFANKEKQDFSLFFNEKFNKTFNSTEESSSSPSKFGEDVMNFLLSEGIIEEAKPAVHEANLKFPKKLFPIKTTQDDSILNSTRKRFFIFTKERLETKSYFWLILIVICILAYCLFPLWPLEVKLGIWWVSWILLVIMIGIISIRLVIYILFYIFGRDFWLFPNLFDDKLGFFDSFKPVYLNTKRNETYFTILIRLIIFVFVVYIGVSLYFNPELIQEGVDHLIEIYSDVLNFGNDKIINYYNTTQVSIVDRSNVYMNKIIEEGIGVDDL